MSTGVSDCAPHYSFLIEQKRPFEVETYRETLEHQTGTGKGQEVLFAIPTMNPQLFHNNYSIQSSPQPQGDHYCLWFRQGEGDSESLGVWCDQERFRSPCCLIAGMCVHAMLWITCRTSHSTRAEAAGSVKSVKFTRTHDPTKPQPLPKQSDQLKKKEPVGFHS